MYLHIGKDTLIDTNGIIAILNIETLEKKENLENVCKNINISDKIIDVSEKNKFVNHFFSFSLGSCSHGNMPE